MAEIRTHSGEIVFVDDDDEAWLSEYKWYCCRRKSRNNLKYARAYKSGRHIYMHRLIMGEPKDLTIDHIDGNGLNNRRENLRICTAAQNVRFYFEKLDADAWFAMDDERQRQKRLR